MKMYKGKDLILSVGLCVIMMAYGCSSTGGINGGVKPELQERDGVVQTDAKGPNFLKSIDIEDYVVRLEAEKGFEYSIAPSSDPFKIEATLKGVEPGVYRDRIISSKEGIGEVVLLPSGVDGALNVEITLTSPLEIVHKQTDNVLTIDMRKESTANNVSIKDANVGSAPNNSKDWVAIKPEEGPLVKSHDSHNGQPLDKQQSEMALDKAMESHTVPVEDSSVRKAKNIIGVSFKRERDSVSVIIQGDGALKPQISSLADVTVSDKIIIDINNVKIAAKLPKEVALPLKALNWEEGKDGVHIVLDLQKETPYEVLTVDDTIIVSLTASDLINAAVNRAVKNGSTMNAANTTIVGKNTYSANANDFNVHENSKAREPKTDVKKEAMVEIQEGSDLGIETCAKKLSCGTQNKISINLQDAPLPAVLRFLAEESGCDIMVDNNIGGTVTLQIKNAAWFHVLTLLQKVHGLACDVAGNIIRIGKWDDIIRGKKQSIELRKMDDDLAMADMAYKQSLIVKKRLDDLHKSESETKKRMDCVFGYVPIEKQDIQKKIISAYRSAKASLGYEHEIQSELFASRYTAKQENKENIKKEAANTADKSPSGTSSEGSSGTSSEGSSGGKDLDIEVSKQMGQMRILPTFSQNKITIFDVESVLNATAESFNSIDVPEKQVLIEAKIIEVSNNMSDTIGINWGFLAKSFDKTNAIGIGRGSGVTGGSFLADMPTTVSNLSGGIALGFINAQRTLGLDIKLQALETSNNGKILTSPRVLTTNNTKVKISQGLQIPYPKMNPQGVISAEFKSVSVNIFITPSLTPNKLIYLNLDISKEDLVGYTKIGGSDAPNTVKISEETQVIVRDGETIVLGGVFKQNTSSTEEGIAGLKDIPLLGGLFKSSSKENKETEYLVFITPRIIDREIKTKPTECTFSEFK
ncbi:type IV pilus secretin PilQ [Candidatus Magnetobacterium bavaricum]|uniref:Type IV pilus secretin PilQ n=1 Tax=Candidatus Magnetobacterium bavaricum TaxID=29290 RepID=A0A0F3GWH9_9BACT|nr:type IV pilus secretin PilQ [Candidatus Magnetobacterium bavaricum]